MKVKNKLQISFRIYNELLTNANDLRKEMATPLNQIQFIVSLISRGYYLLYGNIVFSNINMQSIRNAENDFTHRFDKVPTINTTRFQYRTNTTWMTEFKTNEINKLLYIGLQFEKGKLYKI